MIINYAAADVTDPWAAKKLYTSVAVTLARVRVPTQRPLAPSLT